jgi:hypothetical protein
MLDSLEYRIAKGRIESYEHSADAIVTASQAAQDCLDCEEFLGKGIHACQALVRLDEVVREAIVEGHLQPTPEVRGLVHALFAGWLKQSERAEPWITKHVESGFEMRNLVEFRECCESIEDWLERKDWLDLAAKNRQKFVEAL